MAATTFTALAPACASDECRFDGGTVHLPAQRGGQQSVLMGCSLERFVGARIRSASSSGHLRGTHTTRHLRDTVSGEQVRGGFPCSGTRIRRNLLVTMPSGRIR